MRFVVIRGPEPAGPFELKPGPNVLGRDPDADLRLPSRRVSRRHAVAVVTADHVLLRDMDSANGIVDEAGRRQTDIVVRPGHRVQVGDFVLRLEGVAANDLELDLDDPLTAEDDLLLDNDAEDTPLPQGPIPVMRSSTGKRTVPDPGSVTVEPRPFPPFGAPARPSPPPQPAGRPAAKAAAPAKPAKPEPPPKPDPPPRLEPPPPPPAPAGTARPNLPPSLTAVPPLSDHPTSETSARMPPPLLPFGPATGGFGGFAAPPPPAPPPPPEDRTPLSTPLLPPPAPPPAPPALEAYRNDPPTGSDIGQRASTRLPAIRRNTTAAPPVGGLPWLAQAGGVLTFAVSLLVCAPIGGLGAQLGNTSAVAEELSLQRGEALAEGLANRNGEPLATQRYISLDAASVLQETGVQQAAVTDVNGTVLAPPERARQSITRSPGWTGAVQSGAVVRSEGEDGTWEILAPIRGEAASGAGSRTQVGWAWIVYDPSVTADAASSPILRALAGLMVVLAAAGVVAGGVWWLVLRPLAALRDETEHALHDHVDSVVPAIRWSALEDLAASINRVLQRARAR